MTATEPSDRGSDRDPAPGDGADGATSELPDGFRPTGTVFIITLFVVALVLLWASVYVILLSRGVTT